MDDEVDEMDAVLSEGLSQAAAQDGDPTTERDGAQRTQREAVDAAARAVAASAEAAGVSPEEVVRAAKALLSNLDSEIRSSHERVVEMRIKLWDDAISSLRPKEGGDAASNAAQGERASVGASAALAAELEALGDERCASLDTLIASRRRLLNEAAAERGSESDCDPSSLMMVCKRVPGLWGEDVACAERQLFSFAAAAMMGASVRANALMTCSTTERLSAALCAVRAQRGATPARRAQTPY